MEAFYRRSVFEVLRSRLVEPRRFLQVLAGPRQCGKTTVALQLMETLNGPTHYGSADEPSLKDTTWIEQQWEVARLSERDDSQALLVLDEIQKIPGWSETVKRLWDEDSRNNARLRVLILGSSPLLIQEGLTESLTGRFELIPVSHWSYPEMHEAFGWTVDQYLFFGGYPGSASLIQDEDRWKRYILDSLVEPTISKDILLMTRVNKPALLRQLFRLGCDYSGMILSYQKMLGQLQDAGNTTTLAHYLDLLSGTGLITGLQKYSKKGVKKRGSSPKLQVLNTALITAQSSHTYKSAQKDREYWGRLVESAVGAHLINSGVGKNINVFYWRERSREVDYVLQTDENLTAIEVKTSRKQDRLPGMSAFDTRYSPDKKLLVGPDGIRLEEFFSRPITE